jgi:hypothetical protein
MIGRSDAGAFASRQQRRARVVQFQHQNKDYSLLHEQWLVGGHEHSGIVLAFQQRYSVGEQLRRLLHLLNGTSATEMLSRLEYLSNWGGELRVIQCLPCVYEAT